MYLTTERMNNIYNRTQEERKRETVPRVEPRAEPRAEQPPLEEPRAIRITQQPETVIVHRTYLDRFRRWANTDCGFWTLTILGLIAVILIAVLVPVSFYGLEYNEYGLHRDKLYNKVDYDRVYDNGMYYLGVNQEFISFPRNYNYESFNNLSQNVLPVFSKDGLEFGFQCDYQWRINKNAIPEIHRNFRLAYRQQVNNRVIATIKNTAIAFTTEEFVTSRELVDRIITSNIGQAVSELGFIIPTDKFQFAKPILPENIRVKSLQKVVQLINNDVQGLELQKQQVLQETDVMVKLILSNSTKILSEAQSTYNRILAQYGAESFNLINTAQQTGLQTLFTSMNITDDKTREMLRQTIAIEQNPNVQLYVGISPTSVLSV